MIRGGNTATATDLRVSACESATDRESLRALVERALEGSPQALEVIVDRLTPVIHARIRKSLLRNRAGIAELDPRELLKDLVQEVFLSLWRNDGATLRAWDPAKGASLENFVGLVAERKVIAYLRRGSLAVTQEPPDDYSLALVQDATSPERGAVSKHLLRSLIQHLHGSLTPLGFTLFELLFIWEGTVGEVSVDLGMKPDAVRKWRTRLRAVARRWLQDMQKGETT